MVLTNPIMKHKLKKEWISQKGELSQYNQPNQTQLSVEAEQWPALSCWVRRQVLSTSSCLPRHRKQSKNSTSVASTSFGFCGRQLGRECVLPIPFSSLLPSSQNWMFSVQLNMNMNINRTLLERKVISLQVSMLLPPSD